MRQLLIDKPEGLGVYPYISKPSGGGDISCISEAPIIPFYIENISSEECTVTLSKINTTSSISLDYSYDKITWTTFTTDGAGSFIIPANSKAYIKGDNSVFSIFDYGHYTFLFDKHCNIGGNIISLVGGRNTLTECMFDHLFYGNTNLVSAKNLILPDTVAKNCYKSMFSGCTSLISTPALPATTLAEGCYANMFWGCTSLTTAPDLPATALARGCYSGMFTGCTSLTTAPVLYAITLDNGCYQGMFWGCTNLNYIKAMFTTEPGSNYTGDWVSGVASSGTFIKNSEATWDVTGVNGIPEGWTVETTEV